jgi:hypothetical protein
LNCGYFQESLPDPKSDEPMLPHVSVVHEKEGVIEEASLAHCMSHAAVPNALKAEGSALDEADSVCVVELP